MGVIGARSAAIFLGDDLEAMSFIIAPLFAIGMAVGCAKAILGKPSPKPRTQAEIERSNKILSDFRDNVLRSTQQ